MKNKRKKEHIRRYGYGLVSDHWILMAIFFPLAFTGMLLYRDLFYETYHVLGGYVLVPTFNGAAEMHAYLGLALIIFGYFHILIHVRQEKKPIISQITVQDARATLHTLMYIFFLASRDERGSAGKYKGNQKISYLATLFAIGLLGITAMILFLDILGETALALHITAGAILIFIVVYRIVYLIRMRESVLVKSILGNGKLPVWYAKKNFFKWYREVRGEFITPDEITVNSNVEDVEEEIE